MSAQIYILVLALFAGMLWFLYPFALRKMDERALARMCREKRAIVMTYDDGPNPGITEEIASFLNQHGVAATFFVLGSHAEARPEMTKRLAALGHEIGTHTKHHSNAWKVGPVRAVRDIVRGLRAVESSGVSSSLFRPPFGKATPATLVTARRHGLRLAYWTHDSQDSWDRLPVETVLERVRQTSGGVVLMHDFPQPRRGPEPERHRDYVLELTRRLVEMGEREGFTFLTFGQLTGTRKPSVESAAE